MLFPSEITNMYPNYCTFVIVNIVEIDAHWLHLTSFTFIYIAEVILSN
jgi:hypothetical protein